MVTTLEYDDLVQYACSCSTFSPMVYQYFCKYCVKVRCPDCVTTSVDTFYCPHCFDTVPPMEAKSRKGRCKNCYRCPRCTCVLSTRAHIAALDTKSGKVSIGRDQPATKISEESPPTSHKGMGRSVSLSGMKGDIKKLYLLCNSCHWSSRQANIADVKNVGEFQEVPTEVHKKVSELVACYKKVALQEKAEKDKAKLARKHKHFSLLESSKFDKASLISSRSVPIQSPDLGKDPLEDVAVKASQDPEPLPSDLYTEPLQLDKTMRVIEQLRNPLRYLSDPSELRPLPVLIVGKRLRRCKGCDHILCKSEYNPSSVRFKIQQVALHSLPAVRIAKPPELTADDANPVQVSFTNPCAHPITINFGPCLDIALLKKSGFHNFAKVTLPDGDYHVTAIDDALYEDSLQEQDSQLSVGNPEYIVDKMPGKLVLRFLVAPTEAVDGTKIAFVMNFTAPNPEKAGETRPPLEQAVIMNLSKAVHHSDTAT